MLNVCKVAFVVIGALLISCGGDNKIAVSNQQSQSQESATAEGSAESVIEEVCNACMFDGEGEKVDGVDFVSCLQNNGLIGADCIVESEKE